MIAFLRRYRLHLLLSLLAVIVLVAAFGLIFPSAIGRAPTKTVVAVFPSAPGLYEDNDVDILGVRTGRVTDVSPSAESVRVTIEVPRSTKLPANVRAVLIAPNPISDRSIELYPPYTGGPTLDAGATIPLSRTAVPLGVDQVFTAVSDLARTLGPSGANKNGSLSSVLKSLAALTKGNGRSLQNTLAALAGALPAFSASPNRIASLIDSLDKISTTLARNDKTIDAFFEQVSAATKDLADERDVLASAIGNLQDALVRVAAFVRDNRASIKGSLAGLATTSAALVRDQQALATTFNTAALGFENFNRAVDLTAKCQPGAPREPDGSCPIVFGRLNLTPQSESIVKTYCKSAIQEGLPIIASAVPGIDKLGIKGISDASVANTACVVNYSAVQGKKGTPGAPNTPDLGLERFLR